MKSLDKSGLFVFKTSDLPRRRGGCAKDGKEI